MIKFASMLRGLTLSVFSVKRIRKLIELGLFVLILINVGCKHKENKPVRNDEVVIEVGDSALMLSEVLMQIPSGLNKNDSIALFNSVVESWLKNLILTDIAKSNLTDFEKINKLTEDYRNNLIIEEYLKSKIDETRKASNSEIEEYYNIHKDELITNVPLIKGIYIKIADGDPKLPSVKRWIADGSSTAIDNIEKHGLRDASQYDLFKNSWIKWTDIAEKIPYRFYDADAFLKSAKDFQTTYNGWTYLLHIYDVVATGEPLPKEYAIKEISNILNRERITELRKDILTSLYNKRIEENIIKPGIYNPVK